MVFSIWAWKGTRNQQKTPGIIWFIANWALQGTPAAPLGPPGSPQVPLGVPKATLGTPKASPRAPKSPSRDKHYINKLPINRKVATSNISNLMSLLLLQEKNNKSEIKDYISTISEN